MNRIVSTALAVCLLLSLLFCCSFSSFAANRDESASGNPLVVDNAGLLNASERQALERKARSISDSHSCEVIIVTVDGTGGKTAQEYAEEYFIDHDYGFGANRNGIMLLVDMGERYYHLATRGSAISAFPDDTLLFLESRFLPDYSDKILGVADNSISQSEYETLNAEYNTFMNGGSSDEEPVPDSGNHTPNLLIIFFAVMLLLNLVF